MAHLEPKLEQLSGPESIQFHTAHWKPAGQVVCTVVFVHGCVYRDPQQRQLEMRKECTARRYV